MLVAFGLFFLALALPSVLRPGPRLPTGREAFAFGVLLFVGCFAIVMAILANRAQGVPTWLRLESRGVTLGFQGKPDEAFLWTDAVTWFQLVDLSGYYDQPNPSLGQRPLTKPPSRFQLNIRRGLGRVAYLSEDSFNAVLAAAREAGLEVRRTTSPGGRRAYPRGSIVYVVG